jgi:hypothetical protein
MEAKIKFSLRKTKVTEINSHKEWMKRQSKQLTLQAGHRLTGQWSMRKLNG